MAEKTIKLTEGTVNALNVLKGFEDFATIRDLKSASEVNIASSHLTSLVKNGLAEVIDVEIPVQEVRTLKAYRLTDAGRSALPVEPSDAE